MFLGRPFALIVQTTLIMLTKDPQLRATVQHVLLERHSSMRLSLVWIALMDTIQAIRLVSHAFLEPLEMELSPHAHFALLELTQCKCIQRSVKRAQLEHGAISLDQVPLSTAMLVLLENTRQRFLANKKTSAFHVQRIIGVLRKGLLPHLHVKVVQM
jgi:hypothetical protein